MNKSAIRNKLILGGKAVNENYNKLFPFVLSLFCITIYFYLHREIVFRGDAYAIWEVSKTLHDPNPFHSFVEYRGPFTFYFYNLIYNLSQAFRIDDVAFFRIFSSLLFATLTTLVIPYVFQEVLQKEITALQKIVFSSIALYFFCGYLLHPQVDFLALTFILLSIGTIIALIKNKNIHWSVFFVAGMLAAFSIMTRFNYILSVPIFVLYIYFQNRGDKQLVKQIVIYILPIIAATIIFQSYDVTHSGGVLKAQLYNGLEIEKIEWNAGDGKVDGPLIVKDNLGGGSLKNITR